MFDPETYCDYEAEVDKLYENLKLKKQYVTVEKMKK